MRLILVFAVFWYAVLFVGAAGEPLRIGYSCCNFNDTFQMHIVDAAAAEADSAGVLLDVLDAGEDVATQVRQVESMAASGVDALVAVPVDTARVDALVAVAARAKIPLVFVNRNPFREQRPPDNCFVICADGFVEGETQMLFAGPLIGPLGHVVILQGIMTNEAAQSRTKGVLEVIRNTYPELAIMAEESGNWQRREAREIVTAWIAAYGREKMDAVLSNNDEMALGAVEALEEAGLKDVVVVGVDAIPEALRAIKDGRLAGTVLQDSDALGRGAVRMALRAIAGEEQIQNVILPSEIISRENVDSWLEK